MTNEDKQQAIVELIETTYEAMGFAILNVNPISPSSFKVELIDGEGPKETLVTVLLHMIPMGNLKC